MKKVPTKNKDRISIGISPEQFESMFMSCDFGDCLDRIMEFDFPEGTFLATDIEGAWLFHDKPILDRGGWFYDDDAIIPINFSYTQFNFKGVDEVIIRGAGKNNHEPFCYRADVKEEREKFVTELKMLAL